MSTAPDFPPPLDLTSRKLAADPYPVYRWYREHCPVYRLEPHCEGTPVRHLLTRFEDVERYLKHRALVRQHYRDLPWTRPLDEVPPEHRAFAEVTRQWPLFLDPPCHGGPRRAINRLMDGAFLDRIHGVVERTAQALVRDLPKTAAFDAIGDFSALVPLEASRRLLGLHEATARSLRPEGMAIIRVLGSRFDSGAMAAASDATSRLLGLFETAIEHQTSRPDPEAEMLQGLLDAARKEDLIPESQVAPLGILLLLTAIDTTANLIGNGILSFLAHPEQRDAFLAHPELAEGAAREVARFESPVQQVTRHAAEPLEIRGVEVSAGDGVSFLLGAANRDPAVHPDPDHFDIRRAGQVTSAFGHGIHRCPGERLGRLEAMLAWRAIFTRFPRLAVTGEAIQWLPLVTFRGAESLPVHSGT